MFFLLAVLLVAGLALYLGDFTVRANAYMVTAYFENVQGLANGADVRAHGVSIGRVVEVELKPNDDFPDRPAAVEMAIRNGTELHEGDEFLIQQGALLGDKYVEVRPANITNRLIPDGAAVAGGEAAGLESLTEEARALVKEAHDTVKAVRAVLVTDFNKQALEQILINVMSATQKADVLASQAIRLANILTVNAAKAGPDVVAMARNLRNASASVQNTAELVRVVMATSPVPRDMAVASGNVRQASQDLVAMSENISRVLADPATREKMQGALDNLHQSTADLANLTSEAEKILGDGKLGADIREAMTQLREAATSVANITSHYEGILTDPKFTEDVTATVAAAREAAESGARAVQRAEKSLERVDETMDRVTKVTRIIRPEQVRTRATLEAAGRGGLRADVDVDLQYGDDPNDFWRVGIRDVGDAERLNLQKSFPFGKGRTRVGIFGNKLGAGYDLWPNSRFGIEAEVWDPDDLTMSVRGLYSITPHTEATFGIGSIGEDPDPFVGLRYKTNP